jgi:hypothetical protein
MGPLDLGQIFMRLPSMPPPESCDLDLITSINKRAGLNE